MRALLEILLGGTLPAVYGSNIWSGGLMIGFRGFEGHFTQMPPDHRKINPPGIGVRAHFLVFENSRFITFPRP